MKDKMLFSETHEWLLEEDGKTKVGISSYQAMHIGDINLITLPKVGREVKAGEIIGNIESTKSVTDITSPVSGRILAVNEALVNDPSELSLDPFSNWIFEIEVIGDSVKLMSADEYEATL